MPGNSNTTGNAASEINPKLLDAVKKSTEYVFGVPDWEAQKNSIPPTQMYNAGSAISYEKAAQATAYQIQDSADYLRNMLSISSTVQGKAMAKMLEEIALQKPEKALEYALVAAFAMASSVAATATTEYIGETAAKTLGTYRKATMDS